MDPHVMRILSSVGSLPVERHALCVDGRKGGLFVELTKLIDIHVQKKDELDSCQTVRPVRVRNLLRTYAYEESGAYLIADPGQTSVVCSVSQPTKEGQYAIPILLAMDTV